MTTMYVISHGLKEENYIDKRYNAICSLEHVDKIYPEIIVPQGPGNLTEMWKFDPDYVHYLYISEKLKPIFEEYFSDSGYFVGEVIECYPKPQKGKVIKGYYKWVFGQFIQCKEKEKNRRDYYIPEPLKYDVCKMYTYLEGDLICERCAFSEKAVEILLREGVQYINFWSFEVYLEGEDNDWICAKIYQL